MESVVGSASEADGSRGDHPVATVVPPTSPAEAARLAAQHDNQVSRLLVSEFRGQHAPGKCAWDLVAMVGLSADRRSAVAWILAEAIMRFRCGKSRAFPCWQAAALSGNAVADDDLELVSSFIISVFGRPNAVQSGDTKEKKGKSNHLEGFVAEWLWHLIMKEQQASHRVRQYLSEPSYSVTEQGEDGFVVYAPPGANTSLFFRLWEIKKHNTENSVVTATVQRASDQLNIRGLQYLAKLTSAHRQTDGDLGSLFAELGDLWINADPRAGAGVGVATNTVTPPATCFSPLESTLDQFADAGQLEGLLCVIENFTEFANEVRRMVWSAL
ncbi:MULTISPECIES: hypothetical protein [Pseudonocardiaceae]|uniref:Anti-bacteriophage protein A/HamA C-terminal domain-containing protein n=2 Tax=Pseudonocardiaceae TaxID=2070 RepID=F4CJ12_PSEUX|nr:MULTISPECIES: hypothetical protein [Pseudonocardiaceae]AEA23504.1 hypothetical protein Psed_1259 [Pseudonocardia dioxanivorans CB1190]